MPIVKKKGTKKAISWKSSHFPQYLQQLSLRHLQHKMNHYNVIIVESSWKSVLTVGWSNVRRRRRCLPLNLTAFRRQRLIRCEVTITCNVKTSERLTLSSGASRDAGLKQSASDDEYKLIEYNYDIRGKWRATKVYVTVLACHLSQFTVDAADSSSQWTTTRQSQLGAPCDVIMDASGRQTI